MIVGGMVLCAALLCAPTAGPDTIGPRVRDRFGEAQGPSRAVARDEWLAIDKVQHFAMAYGSAMFGYGLLRGADVSHRDAQAAALAGSLALGIGKELFDRSRGGPFSLRDLAWDALGTAAAWGLLSLNR
jgi:uncharacterized protein YfiM (DUF2279 family)